MEVTIISHGGDNTIVGGAGNDLVFNGSTTSNLLVLGNEGNDNLVLNNNTATVFGGLGNDQISTNGVGTLAFGGEDSDVISTSIGSVGNDTVYGGTDSTAGGGTGDFADTILTGAGNDLIFGGNGNDSIIGGLGVDTMSGGLGADQYSILPLLQDGVVGNSGSTVDFITDANWSEDVIHTGTAATAIDSVGSTTQANINAAATLAAAAAIAAGAGAQGTAGAQIGLGHAGTFTYQGDTYLLENLVTAGFVDGNDLLIRVTGATGTLSTANVVA
jgi:Ca2+-binding RTX toxin-like protein